ncbi:MAG: alpha/beta hydrolase, partial [Chthoniobacterales bacterium]
MKLPHVFFIIYFLVIGLCIAQQPTPSATPRIPGMESANVVMGKGGGRDLHAELDWPTNPPKLPMPAIISIHGGGWLSAEYQPNGARIFVNQGYFTMACEYRSDKESKWPAQIEDCKLAVRWLRANAAKYNVDPNRIGVWGGSAGGHLAALLGTTENHPEFEGSGGYPGVSSKVQAVIDSFGPTDLRDGTCTTGSPTTNEEGRADMLDVVSQLFDKKYSEHPELWA